jgi:hypothetical protein
MKRQWLFVMAALFVVGWALMLTAPAQAAEIGNLSGQSCGEGCGTWHFVNNQTEGAPAGTLTATWVSGDTCDVSASKVLSSTQHFNCSACGALESASTGALPGKLVLSDFNCETKEPPKCDPKTEICK